MRNGLVSPAVLISVGGVLLANNLLPDFDLGRWWPLILIGIGLAWLLDRYIRRLSR